MIRRIPYILALIYLLSGTAHAAFTGHSSGTGTYTPLTQTVDVDNMTATASTTGIDDRALLLDNDGTNNKWTLAYTWLWIKNKADSYYADAITDPGADTVRVWDDTDGAEAFATLGTGLSYDHATHTISAPGTLGSTDIDTSAEIATIVTNETGSGALVFATSPTLVTPILGTPTSGTLTNCTFPTLNQDTTGSAGSLLSTGSTGKMTVIGPGTGTTRSKTVRDANDTILELGGSYTPTGTWDWSSATLTFGTLAPTALTLPSSNADPASSAGAIRHDTTVTGFATGAVVWYDGDEKRYLIDLDTLPEEADDGKALTYDSTYDKFTLSTSSAVGALDDLSDVTLTGAKIGDVLAATTDGEWINIGAGSNGQFLQTRGDGYIPQWATPAGGGDMSVSSYPHIAAIEALAVTDGNIPVANGSTYVAESGATARTSLGAAASGANSDITSLTGLTTALATTMGGMGVKNAAESTVTISGAYPLTITLSNTTGVTFPTSGTLATTAQIPTASSLHLDDALTAVGLTSGYTSMGVVFTGSTITDTTSTVVSALQELETATESASTPSLDIVGDMAADGSIGMTGYKLTLISTLNAAGSPFTLSNTVADLTSDMSLADLILADNGDANGFYLRGYDNTSDLQWSIGQNGNISTAGSITSTNATSSMTMGAASSTITHTGATSLAIASNTGGLSVSAKGTVTIAANGENIIYTGSTDKLTESTSTGVTTHDFGALNLATTGTISGRIPMYTKSSAGAVSTSESQGGFILISAAGTYTLPAAATAGYGAAVVVRVRDASEVVVVDPDGSEKVNLSGTALAAGYAIKSSGTAGDQVCLVSCTDTDGSGTDGWLVTGAYPASTSWVTNGS